MDVSRLNPQSRRLVEGASNSQTRKELLRMLGEWFDNIVAKKRAGRFQVKARLESNGEVGLVAATVKESSRSDL